MPRKKMTFIGASANLMASSMGAGILTLPKALWLGGAILGTVLLIIFGVASALSLIFLTVAARKTRMYSIEKLGERLYGVCGKVAVRLSLLGLLFGAFVIVVIVIGDLATPIWCEWVANGTFAVQIGECSPESLKWPHLSFFFGRNFVTCVVVLIPFGLSIFRSIVYLRHTSTLAVLAVMYVCVALCIKFVQKILHGHEMGKGVALCTDSPINLVLSFPIQFLAYCCQFSVLPIAAVLENNGDGGGDGDEIQEDEPRRRKCCCGIEIIDCSVVFAIALVFLVYTVFGIVGYLYFGSDVQNYSNILNAFPSKLGPDFDALMTAGSICILVTNVLKLPLLALPLRAVFNLSIPALSRRSGADATFKSNWLHVLETFVMYAVCTVVAIVCRQLDIAFQFLGSTAGVAVCFVLPGLFFYRMTILMRVDPHSEALLQPDGLEMQLVSSEDDRSKFGRWCWAGVAMVVFGVITGIITFGATVYQVVLPYTNTTHS